MTIGYSRNVAGLEVGEFDQDAGAITEAELTEQALAADPAAGIAPGAVPLDEFLGDVGRNDAGNILPAWYMPAPMASARLLRGWRRRVVLVIVASFLLINAYGLCSTYGWVGFG